MLGEKAGIYRCKLGELAGINGIYSCNSPNRIICGTYIFPLKRKCFF